MKKSLLIASLAIMTVSALGMDIRNRGRRNDSDIYIRNVIHQNKNCRPYKSLKRRYISKIQKNNKLLGSEINSEIKNKIKTFLQNRRIGKYKKGKIRSVLYDYILNPKSSIKKISAFHKIPESTLEMWIFESKIASRRSLRNRTSQQNEDAFRYYEEGHSIKEIEEKCNFSQAVFHRKLKNRNIPLRKHGQEEKSRKIMQNIVALCATSADITDISNGIQMSKHNTRFYIQKAENTGIIQPEPIEESKREAIIKDYKKGWWKPEGLAKRHSLSPRVIAKIISEAKGKGIRVEKNKKESMILRNYWGLSLEEMEKIKRDYLTGELSYEGICHFNNISHRTFSMIVKNLGNNRSGSSKNVDDAMLYLWNAASQNEKFKLSKSELDEVCNRFGVKEGTIFEGITAVNDWKRMSLDQKEILLQITDENTNFDVERFLSSLDPYDPGENIQKGRKGEHRLNQDFKKYAFLLSNSTNESFAEKFGLGTKDKMKYMEGKARKLKVIIKKELKLGESTQLSYSN